MFKPYLKKTFLAAAVTLSFTALAVAQSTASAMAAAGSKTARDGFRNETEIRDKFNAWKSDAEAKAWLTIMGYDPASIDSVRAEKPHNDKADVVVTIVASGKTTREGISIKLVSGEKGYNQIDKRRLEQYKRLWGLPPPVEYALSLFLGERPPDRPSRLPDRMFLNELTEAEQAAVIEFFEKNRSRILDEIFAGSGPNRARWMLVARKTSKGNEAGIFPIEKAIEFYGTGKIEITRGGSIRIGRITIQRKGGDAGRETARMLQFKINPALLLGK